MRDRKIASMCFPRGYHAPDEGKRRQALAARRQERVAGFRRGPGGFWDSSAIWGKRTSIAQYRIGSKQRRMSLGSIETLDAEEARRRARSALSKVNLGTDPQIERANARIKASVTIGATVGIYLTDARPISSRTTLTTCDAISRCIGRRCTRSLCTPSRVQWSRRGSRRSRQATAYTRESRSCGPVGLLLVGDRRGAGQ